jgi:hypothetical protein
MRRVLEMIAKCRVFIKDLAIGLLVWLRRFSFKNVLIQAPGKEVDVEAPPNRQGNSMSKNASGKMKDPELRTVAKAFLETYRAAAATSDDDMRRIIRSSQFSIFQGGAVELTEELTEILRKFSTRSAQLLGSKAGNERAISELALTEAQEFLRKKAELEGGASTLIEKVFSEANSAFEFLAPNYLIRFLDGIESITIGRVRAVSTATFALELTERSPSGRIRIVPGRGFSLHFSEGSAIVEMHPMSWVTTVNAAKENVEEEAKWLIDVAVSFLRLHITEVSRFYPVIGAVEPHPLKEMSIHSVGVKFREDTVSLGGTALPPNYEVGTVVEAITKGKTFCAKASLVFDPPAKSLAERVAQGCGWLTRARQSENRAERLLHCFTAIEAVLSSDDKSAPIVQTVSRHAAVILSDDISQRVTISSELKKLYSIRSALVHTGNRSVLWNSANLAQYFAEALLSRVLERGD